MYAALRGALALTVALGLASLAGAQDNKVEASVGLQGVGA